MASNTTTANWYTQQYGGSFRTSRLRASSLLGPNSRFQPSVQPTQQTLVVDVQRPNGGNSQQKEESKNVRRRETIFGPDVGEDDEPGWTKADEGTKVDVNVVKGWVEKAKSEEGLHATTTLQALVNLKRPTLLLQQLELEVSRSSLEGQDIAENEIIPATGSRPASTMPGPPVHSLKFNYDAITPLVNITLSIHPTPPAPLPVVEGKEVPSIAEEEPKTVYSGIHSGGFNQLFTLPYEHALDLSSAVAPMTNVNASESAVELDGEDKVVRSEDSTRPWNENALHTLNINSSNAPDLATVPEGRANDNESVDVPAHPRAGVASRVFGRFSRRNREADLESAAQIELQNREQAKEEASKETEEKEPEKGMRLLIRIEAVGPEGQILKRRNAQLTHILISGMWVPEAGSPVGPGQAGKRVWIVKVVRREAVIGAHTFLLKEIYGLSSSTQNTQPTSYPPGEADPYASTPNECIVCLTSPRDVVLLPCRHLVVCRDCAVGMIEFGAGGKVARRDEGDTGTGETPAGGADAAAAAAGAPAPPVAGGTTATGRERRKKKAKGWYCPVCRQPYTSLLRLALPSSEKPEPDDHVHPSRPASIRSVRTTHSRRAPSIAPSLPGGAERMLESLRPHGHDQSDDEDDDLNNERVVERPQFVLGPELDEDDKGTVEHREQAQASGSDVQTAAPKRQSLEGKGWKEAV